MSSFSRGRLAALICRGAQRRALISTTSGSQHPT